MMSTRADEAGEGLSLRHYLDVIKRRKWPVISLTLAGSLLAAAAVASGHPSYKSTARLLVSIPDNAVTVMEGGSPMSLLMLQAGQQGLPTQAELISSAPFLDRVYQKLNLSDDDVGKIVNVSVDIPVGQDILAVTVQTEEKGLSPRVANGIAEFYVEESHWAQLEALKKTREQIEKDSREATAEYAAASNRVVEFRQRNEFYGDANSQGAVRYAEATRSLEDLRRAKDDLLQAQAAHTRYKAQRAAERPNKVINTPTLNPEWSAVEGRLRALREKRQQDLDVYAPEGLEIRRQDSRIQDLARELVALEPRKYVNQTQTVENPESERLDRLIREQEGLISEFQARVDSVQPTVTPLVSKQKLTVNQTAELNRLERERDMASERDQEYKRQLRELKVRETAMPKNVKVLELARGSGTPVAPRAQQYALLGVILGLGLGVGLAMAQEFLDNRVHSPDDAEGLTSLPTLGVVPMIPNSRQPVLSKDDGGALVTECYRAMRTAIQFSSVDCPIRTLVVTSAQPGEGKTVTAINLATVMAFQGHNVILVDADLRRPSVHKLLDMDPAPGLSDVVAGHTTLRTALRPTRVENLQILSCGERAPNPAEMLGSEAMMQAIESLRLEADIIIFDTPPCLPVTDSQVLASQVDASILVIEAGRSLKEAVKSSLELLKQVRSRVIGCVLNKIDQSRKGAYYHYNYYRGGYRNYGDAPAGPRRRSLLQRSLEHMDLRRDRENDRSA